MVQHTYRFLATCQSVDEQLWEVHPEECHHLKKVLRLKEGAEVEFFDGNGTSGRGTLVKASATLSVIQADTKTFCEPPSKVVNLGIGALKPGFLDDLIPSLTELGLTHLHVFLSEGVSSDRMTEKALTRWHRILISASRQCRRLYLPKITCWKNLNSLLENHDFSSGERFFLHPGNPDEFGLRLKKLSDDQRNLISVIVGGEKGFSESELGLLSQKSWEQVGMGPLILRAYTAAISAVSLMSLS